MSVETECCGWDAWGELAGMGPTGVRSVGGHEWRGEPGQESLALKEKEATEQQDIRTVRERHEDR